MQMGARATPPSLAHGLPSTRFMARTLAKGEASVTNAPHDGRPSHPVPRRDLPKAPSGITGLDEITRGGLPRGRGTLVCGGPGSGKTLTAMEFLVRGATEYGEPGIFIAFEETAEELAANVASLGFDVERLEEENKLAIDHIQIRRSEIEETGDYDLEGLFVRLQLTIDTVNAKRVVLDTLESLFSGLSNEAILRSEIRRLLRWLKEREQTVLITAERGDETLTRYGVEEYVSDCVILLHHRVHQQISTRRLRVLKYRGTLHGTNEYPFLIDEDGISVLPESSLGLRHAASTERVSSGIPRLDEMLGGRGYYEGSTILCSGTAGTGKSTLAAAFARAACERGERCLYLAHEESADQLMRNMRSVGIDLEPHREEKKLRLVATRPTAYGLEMHLVTLHKMVGTFDPAVVVIDPVSNLIRTGGRRETQSMLTRLIDHLKQRGTTTLLTSLTRDSEESETTPMEISSIVDSWILLRTVRRLRIPPPRNRRSPGGAQRASPLRLPRPPMLT